VKKRSGSRRVLRRSLKPTKKGRVLRPEPMRWIDKVIEKRAGKQPRDGSGYSFGGRGQRDLDFWYDTQALRRSGTPPSDLDAVGTVSIDRSPWRAKGTFAGHVSAQPRRPCKRR